MTLPTFSIRVSAGSDAQALVDALRRPRHPESGDPGLGPSTCPEDATDLPELAQSEAQPDDTAQERWLTLPVYPRDVDVFESIVESNPSAEAKRWHPEGKADVAHDTPPPFTNASEHPAADGLERIPSEANT